VVKYGCGGNRPTLASMKKRTLNDDDDDEYRASWGNEL